MQLLDPIDYRILEILQRDGRATQLEIAKAVGLSQPSVADRIHKLEEKGVISGYAAMVDATRLGKDITAFIGVSIEHPKHFDGFARRILQVPEVQECHRVAGESTYLLKVKTDNTRTLDSLLSQLLRTIPGVTKTLTTIVLSSIKEGTRVPLAPAKEEDR
jgi:Lrp/AsnC family transcriptional regulator, leucine-responsive regulatory protein